MIYRVILVIIVTFFAGGCGTLLNVVNYEVPSRPKTSIKAAGKVEAPRKIYGGVALDGEIGKSWIEDGMILPTVGFWLVDVPLSAVGDMLTLPLTIRAAIDRSIEDYYFRDDETGNQTSQEGDVREASFEE